MDQLAAQHFKKNVLRRFFSRSSIFVLFQLWKAEVWLNHCLNFKTSVAQDSEQHEKFKVVRLGESSRRRSRLCKNEVPAAWLTKTYSQRNTARAYNSNFPDDLTSSTRVMDPTSKCFYSWKISYYWRTRNESGLRAICKTCNISLYWRQCVILTSGMNACVQSNSIVD